MEEHAETVTATCSRSARVQRPPGEEYDWVIIDEAGRASPFELLVPMVQGKRIVLIGDHRQLPPMVKDALAEAADANVHIDISQDTLFGEFMKRLPPANKVRLGTQYRMHGDIGEVIDQCFYRPKGEELKKKLRNDSDSVGHRIATVAVAARVDRTFRKALFDADRALPGVMKHLDKVATLRNAVMHDKRSGGEVDIHGFRDSVLHICKAWMSTGLQPMR